MNRDRTSPDSTRIKTVVNFWSQPSISLLSHLFGTPLQLIQCSNGQSCTTISKECIQYYTINLLACIQLTWDKSCFYCRCGNRGRSVVKNANFIRKSINRPYVAVSTRGVTMFALHLISSWFSTYFRRIDQHLKVLFMQKVIVELAELPIATGWRSPSSDLRTMTRPRVYRDLFVTICRDLALGGSLLMMSESIVEIKYGLWRHGQATATS